MADENGHTATLEAIPTTAGPTLHLHCAQCTATEGLLRCSRCRMTRYCSKEHQTADWPSHKKACAKIIKLEASLVQQKDDLGMLSRFDPTSGQYWQVFPFVDEIGHFGDMPETNQYLTTKASLVSALLALNSYDGAEEAVDNIHECLRLDRRDSLRVRNFLAPIYLRMGHEQDCYDFIRYWQDAEMGGMGDEWDDNLDGWFEEDDNPACLEDQWEDMFEDVEDFCGAIEDFPTGLWCVSHGVTLTLLKIRLYIDIKNCLQRSNVLREANKLPPEIYDEIEQAHLAMVIAYRWHGDIAAPRASQLSQTLLDQIHRLYETVREQNRHVWPRLANRDRKHLEPLDFRSPKCLRDSQALMAANADSWEETPGAIDFLKTIVEDEGDQEDDHFSALDDQGYIIHNEVYYDDEHAWNDERYDGLP